MEIDEVKFHELDGKFGKKQATEMRRKKIEEMLNVKLEHLSKHSIDPEGCIGKNIENMIGAVQIPVGIAGEATRSAGIFESIQISYNGSSMIRVGMLQTVAKI